jgi:hypothetical protein
MKRRNPYLVVGVALAILIYIVLVRGSVYEALETAVFICNENQAGRVPPGATKVKYGAGDKWVYIDAKPGDPVLCMNAIFGDPAPGVGKACYGVVITPDPPAPTTASPGDTGMGIMPSIPCKVSELSKGIWGHKGVTAIPERFEPTSKEAVTSAKDCATKCCTSKECTAFAFHKTERVCWLYNADPKKLESVTQIHDGDKFEKGSVDKSGGMNDLIKSVSGGFNETVSSIYGFLGSGLSIGAIVGVILAVLAIGIPLAVYLYKFFGGSSLSGSSVPVGNPVTRMSVPGAGR